jgi:hypothetical protein
MLIVLSESGASIVHGIDGNHISQMAMRQELTIPKRELSQE